MTTPIKHILLAASLCIVQTGYSAITFAPVTGFNPNTHFNGGITAGIDFDVDSSGDPGAQYVTQSGFLSVPASNATTINVTTGGITFDLSVSGTNAGNQNRWRGNANAGALINDFAQWFNNTNSQVEGHLNLSGLTPNADYEITFFIYNVGAGQNTHLFYEGTSSASPLITSFTTSGNQNNYSTWSPGITFFANSGSLGEIDITAQSNVGSGRLTFNGISVIAAIPEPSTAFLSLLGGIALVLRRRR